MNNEKTASILNKHNFGLYCSLIGSFGLGTINLVNTLMNFSFLMLNYALFSYLFFVMKIVLYLLRNNKYVYLSGAIWFFILSIPFSISMLLTIVEKDDSHQLLSFATYVYAIYAVTKIILSTKAVTKEDKTPYEKVDCMAGLFSTLFTVELLSFSLIATFGSSENLFILQLLYQGVVGLVYIGCIVHLLKIHFSNKKNIINEEH